jgi:hypothetical protein
LFFFAKGMQDDTEGVVDEGILWVKTQGIHQNGKGFGVVAFTEQILAFQAPVVGFEPGRGFFQGGRKCACMFETGAGLFRLSEAILHPRQI